MPDKKRLGDTIGYPGMPNQQTEESSVWDKIRQALAPTPNQAPAAMPSSDPSGTPYLDPEKARQFQKGFFGQ
jgi:hypothetical protein